MDDPFQKIYGFSFPLEIDFWHETTFIKPWWIFERIMYAKLLLRHLWKDKKKRCYQHNFSHQCLPPMNQINIEKIYLGFWRHSMLNGWGWNSTWLTDWLKITCRQFNKAFFFFMYTQGTKAGTINSYRHFQLSEQNQ